jgi:hypothetical protein
MAMLLRSASVALLISARKPLSQALCIQPPVTRNLTAWIASTKYSSSHTADNGETPATDGICEHRGCLSRCAFRAGMFLRTVAGWRGDLEDGECHRP